MLSPMKSIDGSTSLSGLLVHDSSREADLDEIAYAKLLEFVENQVMAFVEIAGLLALHHQKAEEIAL